MRRPIALASVALLLFACSPHEPAPSPSFTPSARVSPTATGSPPPAAALTFAVVGDWGAGTGVQRVIAERMCAARKARLFRTVVTTGDNFYSPDGVATDRTYWSPERCLIEAGIVWRAAWGNHDVRGDSTASVLGSRSHWFAWSEGGADFFVLDSNQVGDAEQRRWLAGRLEASRAAVKIVVFHHPPYTVGEHAGNAGVQREWVPLFERYRVTLVLNGHNHDYEHSRVDGVDYVVSGGGGGSVYPCLRQPSFLLACRSANHFLMVEVRGTHVSVEAVAADGETLDRFTIEA